jgi:hypothetical protein
MESRISGTSLFGFLQLMVKKRGKKEMFVISPKVFGIPVQEYRSTYLGVGENPGHSVGGCGLLVLCVKKNI